MISRVLIAVEDFLFADEIESFLTQLQTPELELKILHVIDPAEAVHSWPSTEYRIHAEDLLKTLNNRLIEKFPKSEVETQMREGKPRDLIVEEAKAWRADLILMGPHGRKGIDKLLLGSTAKSVIPLAPCSIVLLRSRKRIAPKVEKAELQGQRVST